MADPVGDPDAMPEPADSDVEEESDTGEDELVLWLSAEAQAKRRYYKRHARRQFANRYRAALSHDGRNYRFPIDLDRLGTTAGASQIAIVHVDGNGIGRLMTNLADKHRGRRDDEAFRKELVVLSEEISRIANNSFGKLIQELVEAIPSLEMLEIVKLREDKNCDKLLPLRPIVDAGDDLTFVCHGKLALSLAVRHLQLFENESGSRKLTASAGVVVMPQKFPFAQAYALAESLSGKAKTAWRGNRGQGSWIDFHLQIEGRTGDLDSFRASQYPRWERLEFPGRPFRVTGSQNPTWLEFAGAWTTFSEWPRGESKRFFETFAGGPDDVDSLRNRLKQYRSSPLRVPQTGDAILFDALEFLDFHVEWPPR